MDTERSARVGHATPWCGGFCHSHRHRPVGTTTRHDREERGGPEAVSFQARYQATLNQARPERLQPNPGVRPVHTSHLVLRLRAKTRRTHASQRIDPQLTQTVELRLALREPLRVGRIHEEDDPVHFGEVVPPQAAGLHVPTEVVRGEFDVADGELLGGWGVSGVPDWSHVASSLCKGTSCRVERRRAMNSPTESPV